MYIGPYSVFRFKLNDDGDGGDDKDESNNGGGDDDGGGIGPCHKNICYSILILLQEPYGGGDGDDDER